MRIITHEMAMGPKIFVQDETIVSSDGKLVKKYWCNEDEHPIYTWKWDHGKFIAYGMISISGERFFRSHDKFDGPTFLRYVKDAVAKYGRILIIVDRARQHRTIKIEECIKENKDKIRIEYLPKASPQHNILEIICLSPSVMWIIRNITINLKIKGWILWNIRGQKNYRVMSWIILSQNW